MKRHIVTLIIALCTTVTKLRADTSYLLIQGPFGTGSTEATFKWQVNYQSGVLAATGQDLLNAVFGIPSPNGTFIGLNYYKAGNSTLGAGYVDFGTTTTLTEPFLVSVTLGGIPVVMDPSYSPGYNYYVAGGGSAQAYPNAGSWTYSGDGTTTRTLVNGSYDGWVFGNSFPAATIDGGSNTPTTENFAGATVINVVPEPASATLLLAGLGGLLAFSKRRRA